MADNTRDSLGTGVPELITNPSLEKNDNSNVDNTKNPSDFDRADSLASILVPNTPTGSLSDSDSTKSSVSEPEVDRGWAWIILLASFLLQFIADGLAYSFGVFFVEISEEFSSSGKSEVSWIPSIMIAATHVVGPIGSVLVNKYGCRTVSIFGSVLAAIGFGLGYFAQNVVTLYFTVGVIGGVGFGFMYLPAMVIVPQFFDKRRATAVGIAVCGSGLGTFFFEWVIGFILETFTWREGLGIVSGIILSSIAFAMVYRAGPRQNKEKVIEEPLPPVKQQTGKCEALHKMIDLTLLKNPLFLIFCVCEIMSGVGYNVPYLYLPEIEKRENGGVSGSSLLGIIGIANVVCRVSLGFLSDKLPVNRFYIYTCALILAGIGTIVSPHFTTIWWLRIYAGMYGACMGTYVGLKPVILIDLIGLDKLTDAFGLMLLIQSIGFLSGPPIVGMLYDVYGIYKPGFYFAGTAFVTGGCILFLLPLIKSRRQEAEADKLKV